MVGAHGQLRLELDCHFKAAVGGAPQPGCLLRLLEGPPTIRAGEQAAAKEEDPGLISGNPAVTIQLLLGLAPPVACQRRSRMWLSG